MDCSLDDYVKQNKISSKKGGNNFYNKGNGKFCYNKFKTWSYTKR